MSILIKNGIILTAENEFEGDILIKGEKIAAIGVELKEQADNMIDAKGKYVIPGGVDQHVHFNYTYLTAKVRGYETSNAPLVGGTTTIVDFANRRPGWSMKESFEKYMEEQTIGKAMCDYAFHGGIVAPDDDLFREIPHLPESGVTTINIFMSQRNNSAYSTDDEIFRALQAAKSAGVTTMIHAENVDVINVLTKQLLSQGYTDPIYHAFSRPILAEAESTQRAVYLGAMADAPIIVAHVTCREAMEIIRDAYAKGMPAYGETCLQYLIFDSEYLAQANFEGAKYVCNPPLRAKEHNEAMWNALRNGWLECVSTDHCAFDWLEQKHLGKNDFTKIPKGMPGVQDRLGVIWTYGVEAGKINRQKFVDLFSTKPAKIMGLYPRKGTIAVDSDADLVIFDPAWEGVMSVENSLHQIDYCAYEGMKQIGRVEKVFLRGKLTVDDNKFVGQMGQGKFIKGEPFGFCYQGLV